MKKRVLEIMDLAIEVTNNTATDVFVDYYGHTGSINVRVYADGWSDNVDFTKEWTVWLNDEPIIILTEVSEYLQTFTDATTIIEDLEEKVSDIENEVEGLKEQVADLENELVELSNEAIQH